MKKILSSSIILAAIAVVFTGCLKDKGYDNFTYGIGDPNTQPPGVGFPLASSSKYTVGLDAGVPTNQAIGNVAFIKLYAPTPVKSDVTVTYVLNDALRTAYNTANGTNILAFTNNGLPSGTPMYSLAFSIVIKAGSDSASVPINIPTTVPLDPSNSYGVGLTITSVTGGYTIASNLKDLFLEFTLKNKYDGNYRLQQNTQGWGAYGITDDLNYYTWPSNGDGTSIFLITGGPNSVRVYDDWGFGDFIQVTFTGVGGGGLSGFGATAPRYIFNTATNRLENVINDAPPDSRNRAFRINPAIVPPAGNYWDPSTRNIYASYIMSQTGRPDQFINCIYTYRGPRP